jgi:hypothetical protein
VVRNVVIECKVRSFIQTLHRISCAACLFRGDTFTLNKNVIGVRFEVFTAVKIEFVVSWVAALCSVMVGYQHFRGSVPEVKWPECEDDHSPWH